MLLELYSIFEELEIIQNCTKYSFIDFVVANKVTTANDLIVFPKEPTKVIYKNFYLKKDTTHLDSLLKSDLGIIIKNGSHKDAYKQLCKCYKDDKLKNQFMVFFNEEIDYEKNNISTLKDFKDACKKTKFLIKNEPCKNATKEDNILRKLPNKLWEAVYLSDSLSEAIYTLCRYAIVREEPFFEDGYNSYLDDREDYFNCLLNNLLEGNINKKGVLNYLVKNENSIAMFEKATSLLFGNGMSRSKDKEQALNIYEDIIEKNSNMPLAHWGIGYILLYYPRVYEKKHGTCLLDKERFDLANEHAKISALSGCGAAYNLLGCIHREASAKGIQSYKNIPAAEYFTKSLEHEYLFSLNNLGKNELKKVETSKTEKEAVEYRNNAFKFFKELADKYSEPYACNEVGRFLSGQYKECKIKIDLEKAFNYWVKAKKNDETKYYSLWPSYNIVKCFYDKKELNDKHKEQLKESFLYLQDLGDDFKYSDKRNAELRDDCDGEECYKFLEEVARPVLEKNGILG